MGRLFSCLLLSCSLALAVLCPARNMYRADAQPVFFSMLFPQLIPECLLSRPEGEVAFL